MRRFPENLVAFCATLTCLVLFTIRGDAADGGAISVTIARPHSDALVGRLLTIEIIVASTYDLKKVHASVETVPPKKGTSLRYFFLRPTRKVR